MERHSPLSQQRLKVNPQMVQMQISLTNVKSNKATILSMQCNSLKLQYNRLFYRGRTQSLVAKKKDISENRASRNFDLMITQRRLIAADQASVFMAMTSVHISSGLVLHQMTSDHNRIKLEFQTTANEHQVQKAGPKVVP
ncbi:hypothetical protein Tco_0758403 [Tanacetum coccineum]